MQKQDSELFKTVSVNNAIYLDIQRGFVYFPNQQIDPDAGNNGQIFKGYIGYNTDKQQECCVKRFPITSKDYFAKQYQELLFGRQLVHKNIVKYFECQTSEHNFYIFMEYCNGGSLAKRMSLGYEDDLHTKIFPEKESINIIQQVIDALIYMKQLSFDGKSGAVHRDIKPDNIMFSNDIPKLIDFGMARCINSKTITPYQGTPIYMSPQNFNDQSYDLEKNDVWGIGIILFQLVEGIYPWRMLLSTKEDLQKAHESIRNNLKFNQKISEGLQNLIRNMLQFEEKDRYDWDQVINHELMKPYFCNSNRIEINELDRLVQNYEKFEKLQAQLNIEKLNKYVLDLTLTKINQLKEFLPKNSQLHRKIDQMYIQRILQKRNFHTFKSERTLKNKLQQRLVRLLEQMILDNLNENQTKGLNVICQIVIPLYKTYDQSEYNLSIVGLLQQAKL